MTSGQPEPGRWGSGDLPDSTAGDRLGTSNDSRLVQRAVSCAKEGDPEGLHFLYVRYASDVLHYVAGFVHDDDEAEDVTQSVFAKLATTITKYQQREGQFAAWILRVAREVALDHTQIPTEEARAADAGLAQTSFDRSRDHSTSTTSVGSKASPRIARPFLILAAVTACFLILAIVTEFFDF